MFSGGYSLILREIMFVFMPFFFSKIITCGRDFNLVRMAIVSGYFTNAAKRDPQEGYRTMTEGQVVYMHPCKSQFFPCTCMFFVLAPKKKREPKKLSLSNSQLVAVFFLFFFFSIFFLFFLE